MKLYDVPRNTNIRVLGDVKAPPQGLVPELGEVLKFSHIDGMYSFCTNSEGNIVHLVAWAEVEIINEN